MKLCKAQTLYSPARLKINVLGLPHLFSARSQSERVRAFDQTSETTTNCVVEHGNHENGVYAERFWL